MTQTSAPEAVRSVTVAAWPLRAAQCSGVLPAVFLALTRGFVGAEAVVKRFSREVRRSGCFFAWWC